jgi:membrane protease YdiL (CAAX protease family)
MENPVLFPIIVILISIVVPVLEELLFRGCLQSWISQKLGKIKAILITSIVFALFHFSRSQGLSNLELFAALFVLSCYLGYLYERQQSLLAPIALHSIFNAISISMLSMQKF